MTGRIDFVAIDVETANADLASICQIGIAKVQDGKLKDIWSSLVDPEDFFDPVNISIHGISESDVEGAPKFNDVFKEVDELLSGVVVSHTTFDRTAIARASKKYKIPVKERTWLCSARVTRRAWPEKFSERGYGLKNVASNLGIDFMHHDAAEDAKAAAEIVIRACEETSLDIDGWIQRVEKPIFPRPYKKTSTKREGDAEGPLFGETLVFTGALKIPRREAADLAASIGCSVHDNVTKKTTLLVVGDQDIRRLKGHQYSSKHRRAKALIEKGHPIRILRESDFKDLIP